MGHMQKLFLVPHPHPGAIFSLCLHPGFQAARETCQCLAIVPFLLLPGEALMGVPTVHCVLLQVRLYPSEPRPKTLAATIYTSCDIKLHLPVN